MTPSPEFCATCRTLLFEMRKHYASPFKEPTP
jgi:hypothetical protein